MQTTISLAALACLAIVFCAGANPQIDDNTTYVEGFIVPATKTQKTAIYDAETKNWSELEGLRDELSDIKSKIRKLELEQKIAVQQLLTKDQTDAINKQRLAATQKRVANSTPFLRDFAIFSAQLADAKNVSIFEGILPVAKEQMAKIRASANLIRLDGFEYYEKPVAAKPDTVEILRDLLTDHKRYSPTPGLGGKFTGGVAPNFCLQYAVSGKILRTHILMGYSEIQVVTPEKTHRFDFTDETWSTYLEIARSIFENGKF